jgi:hypothetical protein
MPVRNPQEMITKSDTPRIENDKRPAPGRAHDGGTSVVGRAAARLLFERQSRPHRVHLSIQEPNVWKKAGIVISASLAAGLAVAPLANASESPEGDDDAEQVISGDDAPQAGLLNLGDLNVLNDLNVCPDVTGNLGLGPLLGNGSSDPDNVDAPVDCDSEDD